MLSYVYASIMMLFLSTYDVAASMEIATCQFQCLCNNVLQNLISATFATTFFMPCCQCLWCCTSIYFSAIVFNLMYIMSLQCVYIISMPRIDCFVSVVQTGSHYFLMYTYYAILWICVNCDTICIM